MQAASAYGLESPLIVKNLVELRFRKGRRLPTVARRLRRRQILKELKEQVSMIWR